MRVSAPITPPPHFRIGTDAWRREFGIVRGVAHVVCV